MSLQCLHKVPRSFAETSWTSVPRPNTLHQHFKVRSLQTVKECSQTLFNASDCLWLAGLDFSCQVTGQASQLTMAHCSIPFLSCLATSTFECFAWMSNQFISIWEVHNGLWDPNYLKCTSQPCWSGKMHIICKLFNWPRLLCFLSIGSVYFLNMCMEL